MYEQPPLDNVLFYMLYAAVTALSLIACVYLLFRRGNAFAPDVTPPLRLRRWTAALFASMALAHLWYLPIAFSTSIEAVKLIYFIGGLLDYMTLMPLTIIVLLTMLQDRRRPLWPVAVMMAPLVVGIAWSIANRSEVLLPAYYVYLLLLGIGLIIYMVRAVRQYGRWLRDNYADLEHKEVGQSFVVLSVILLFCVIYISGLGGPAYKYIVQVGSVVLTGYLLWRVETLSDLSLSQTSSYPITEEETTTTGKEEIATTEKEEAVATGNMEDNGLPQTIHDGIEPLLQQHCIDTQLYLQHDLTLQQLAKAIGTNRYYLSQYFSNQGMTYNAYINNLRINHFVSLYQEAVASQRSFTAQQLAFDSGYHSYSTFSLAFKPRMGQNVTTWMRDTAK